MARILEINRQVMPSRAAQARAVKHNASQARGHALMFAALLLMALFVLLIGPARADDAAPLIPVSGKAGPAAAPESAAPAPAPAPAHPLQANAHDVIRQQLAAIRNRDAEGAYALMTAAYHDGHGNAREFLGKLRFDNRAIYNHRDITFLDELGSGPISVQKVRISDHFGQPVTVIYRLEQQADGQWLIGSFTALDSEALPI